LGEREWTSFGENRWTSLGENHWTTMGENHWTSIARKMTPGFRTVEQVEENAAALRRGPISEAQMEEIRRLKLARPAAGASQ
jgi:hypothetical protein